MQLPPSSSSRTFPSLQNKIPMPSRQSAPLPSPQLCSTPAPASISLHSIHVASSILDISFKQNHTKCDLLRLAPFTWHYVFKVIHEHQNAISFYSSVTFHCQYTTAWLSVDGHWGCVTLWAVVHSAALNIRVHFCFQFYGAYTWG